jgi:homoserine O-acetyltransferase
MFPNPLDVIPWIKAQEDAVLKSGFDANDWIAQTWAYDRHNVGDTPGFGGDHLRALRSIRAKTLIVTAGQLDLYNPVEEAEEAAKYILDSRLVAIPSIQGHVAAGPTKPADVEFMNRVVGEYLRKLQ